MKNRKKPIGIIITISIILLLTIMTLLGWAYYNSKLDLIQYDDGSKEIDTSTSYAIDNDAVSYTHLDVYKRQVVEYQVYNKIFNLPMTMVMLVTTSLWSTITKAKAENDWKWIRASYSKYMKIAFLLGAAEFAVIIPLQWIFNFWLGDKTIPVNYGIAVIFALSGTVMSLRTILANYSNGLCELRVQTIYMTIGAVVNIPLAYVFSRISGSYIAIVLANIVSMAPYLSLIHISGLRVCRDTFRIFRPKSSFLRWMNSSRIL